MSNIEEELTSFPLSALQNLCPLGGLALGQWTAASGLGGGQISTLTIPKLGVSGGIPNFHSANLVILSLL